MKATPAKSAKGRAAKKGGGQMKLYAKGNTYTAAGKVKAGDVFEVDDKAGEAMLAAGIAKKAAQSAEVTEPAEAGTPGKRQAKAKA